MNHINLCHIINDLQAGLHGRLREEDIAEWRIWMAAHLRLSGCLADDQTVGDMTREERRRFIDEHRLEDMAIQNAERFELKEDHDDPESDSIPVRSCGQAHQLRPAYSPDEVLDALVHIINNHSRKEQP